MSNDVASWLLITSAICMTGCGGPPPYGEVVLAVDIDVPARLAEQLRVDVYADDGRWLESRTVARLDGRDWPTSFSVVAPTEAPKTDVLVRLRAYPTGRLRDYLGERFETRPVFEPMVVPTSLEQACADPPVIDVGTTRWVRGGREKFIDGLSGGNCAAWPTAAGAGVLRVDIEEPGLYRFAALATQPPNDAQISLQLRSACTDADTWKGCEAGLDLSLLPNDPGTGGPLGYLPELEVNIEEEALGSYFIFVTNGGTELGTTLAPWEAQVVVGRVDAWQDVAPADDDAPWSWTATVPEATTPLELENGRRPPFEPRPDVTIDRLVRLELEYGTQRAAHVTLHGACFGTMSKLAADPSDPVPQLDGAETCVDTENERQPVPLAPVNDLGTTTSSELASFPEARSCDDGLVTEDAVCVPAGIFLFGDSVGTLNFEQPLSTDHERVAVMSPFWIDRREVTVARWRKAIADGFVPPDAEDAPYANDRPFSPTQEWNAIDPADRPTLCTYSSASQVTTTGDREGWPVNCLSWYGARAFCQFYGGDLPTEAQWEYVATAAGRARDTIYPWGNDPPTCSPADCEGKEDCHFAVAHRSDFLASECLGAGYGPTDVSAYEGPHGDVTVQLNADPGSHVFGLAGGMEEFVLDSIHPYTAPCWRSNSLEDPRCWEEDAAVRARRGAHWSGGFDHAAGAVRGWVRATQKPRFVGFPIPLDGVGFRCVYPSAPVAP